MQNHPLNRFEEEIKVLKEKVGFINSVLETRN